MNNETIYAYLFEGLITQSYPLTDHPILVIIDLLIFRINFNARRMCQLTQLHLVTLVVTTLTSQSPWKQISDGPNRSQ